MEATLKRLHGRVSDLCQSFSQMQKPGFLTIVCLFCCSKQLHCVGTVNSDFVGFLPDIEMNDTSSPAIKHRPSK